MRFAAEEEAYVKAEAVNATVEVLQPDELFSNCQQAYGICSLPPIMETRCCASAGKRSDNADLGSGLDFSDKLCHQHFVISESPVAT